MTPPIIVNENGDVTLYQSAETAARALEPIDVKNNEYVVYDSEGFVLLLECAGPRVFISGRAASQPQAEKLTAVLRAFWERASRTSWPATASVSQAVAQSCKRFGYAV